ncbi:MAG: hypothetical protein ABI262_10070, partial [Microcoleus sp.]
MIKYWQFSEVESVAGYELQSFYSSHYRRSRLTQKPGFSTKILDLNPEFEEETRFLNIFGVSLEFDGARGRYFFGVCRGFPVNFTSDRQQLRMFLSRASSLQLKLLARVKFHQFPHLFGV